MQKLAIELPRYRLLLHFRAVKKRKSIFDEALVPSVADVKKKYRKGNLLSRYFRHIFEHKNIKKVLGGSFTFVVIATSLVPQNSVLAQGATDEPVIQVQNTLTTEKSVQNPLARFRLNQGFSFFHPGVDLGASIGDPVKPMKDGVVIQAGYENDGYGKTILIEHGHGMTTRYAHLSKINVKEGDKVNLNTTIGLVGVTGHTTGPHLHLEVRIFGLPQNPLNYIAPSNLASL